MKSWMIILLLFVVFITFFFVFGGLSHTGYFSFFGLGSEKSNIKADTGGSCIAQFDSLRLDVSNYLSSKKVASSGECNAMFNNNKDKILNNICSNSDTLGDVVLTFNGAVVSSYTLECSEALVDSDVPIIISGEIIKLYADYFDEGRAELITQIKEKTGKIYTLEAKNEKERWMIDSLSPGKTIKARGIKDASKNSFVLGNVEKSIREDKI